MSENEMILAGGADLVKQSELYEPMLYYGSKARITVDYVSDIHLLHHAPYFNYDIQKTIRAIAKSLYESMSFVGIESGKVAAFNIIGYIACHFLERGAFCHIFVVNAMNGRSLFRYVHFGIDAHGFGFLVSVGIYFEITDFYYSVRVNVCTKTHQNGK